MPLPYLLSLAGAAALIVSPFLPWLRMGSVGLAGVPDPAGYFVVGVGAVAAVLSLAGWLLRREMRQALILAGLAAMTTLGMVWWTGPARITDRATAHAEAIAIVDNLPVQSVPPARVGYGLLIGLVGAAAVAAAGATGAFVPD